ncbi:MAG: hypothetical protein LW690_14990 [Opitutaceae bacterium]|nr:hypothetical protein [Opitutaceae bacterium]
MDDNASPEKQPAAEFNKIDLSQLQGFSFGTQWSQEKPGQGDHRDSGERPRRDGGGPDRRDRRGFRRPAGEMGGDAGPGGPARRDDGGERRFRGGGPGDFRGGPRREGGPREGGGERGGFRRGPGGPQFGGRGAPQFGPYESPYFTATFYPEDSSFNTLVQTIRKSCRTVELFEIARTVVAKDDRFVVVLGHRAPAAPAGAEAAPAAAKPLFHIAVPDGLPFDSDEAAVAHVISVHLERFFDKAEVEIEAPKGSYQVINRCGVTGELLGPPNYHRYNQIVQQHYTSRLSGRMGPEAFRGRIETVRDPELVNQWLAKMKKATRYTWKTAGAEAPAASPVADAPAETPAEAPAAENAAPAAPATPFFDTLEDARLHLLTHARDKVVRTSENARFAGRLLETLPPGEIRRAVEGALERQRRFPLDTANGLRGRLRREHFTIFKKGSKGVSYVCAVKRKFRVPGQTFADSIGTLIAYIEANPMVRAGELPVKFLGLKPAVAPAQVSPAPASAEGSSAETPAAPEVAAAKTEEVSIEDRARLARLQGDLMWLVREGYVTEFIDGRLFAPPVMVEARKKEIESEEHDPENFPEAPASAETAGHDPSEPPATETTPAGDPVAPVESVAEAAPDTPPPESPASESPPAAS